MLTKVLSRTLVTGTALGLAAGLAAPTLAVADVPARPGRGDVDFRGIVEIFNCSGSLVRWADSRPDDQAMMLTNGHCYQVLSKAGTVVGRSLAEGEATRDVIVDVPDSRKVTLLGRNGADRGVVRAQRLLYSTSYRTDVGLYLLRKTYAEIRAEFRVGSLTIADAAPGTAMRIQMPSGYSRRYYRCRLDGSVRRLFNDDFEWRRSLRIAGARTCRTVHGTSGSPMLDPATREVVGINNAINLTEAPRGCRFALCEQNAAGEIKRRLGQRYGQQTWWLTTCVGTDRRIDLEVEGCRLPKPPPA